MTENQNIKPTVDEQLADFTDRILDQQSDQQGASLASDPELGELEQTALHLKNAFGDGDPSEVVIRRMRENIGVRWQQQEKATNESSWKKWLTALIPPQGNWQSQRSRQRWSIAISLVIIFALMLVGTPLLKDGGSNQPAASGQILTPGVLAVVGGLVLITVWLFRRK